MQPLDDSPMNQIQEYSGKHEVMTLGHSTVKNIIFDQKAFENVQRIAEVMAKSNVTVPAHLKNNVGDCMAVVMQAMQWGMNPWPVAQKTHLVSGNLGYEAQLVNAVITSMAPTKDRIHYEWFGPWENVIGNFVEKTSQKGNTYTAPGWKLADEKGLGVRVWATLKGEDEPRELELLLSQAQPRNSTLWATDPKQQLAYLAVKRWARLYCPDVILGVYSNDELEAVPERDITPTATHEVKRPASRTAGLKDKISKAKGAPVVTEAEKAEAVETVEADPDYWLQISTDIDNAQNANQLKAAIANVEKLNDEQKAKARFAYKFRECELKGLPVSIEVQEGKAHIVNAETGEVIF